MLVSWTAAVAVASAAAASIFPPPAPRLIWNASPSSPVGLYSVTQAVPGTGEMAVAWPPGPVRRLAAGRSYLPRGVPLVKHVAAVAGDRVCAKGARIFINGREAAVRRVADPGGRPMPWWSGCTPLGRGDLFLLSPVGPLAFDGRYFGVTRRLDIVGKARLLWPR